jgi:hypothetical protein
MPRYEIASYIISDWTCQFEAEHEQGARDMAYAEIECDIPPGGYAEFTVREVKEKE